jgi:hypothetical protein
MLNTSHRRVSVHFCRGFSALMTIAVIVCAFDPKYNISFGINALRQY